MLQRDMRSHGNAARVSKGKNSNHVEDNGIRGGGTEGGIAETGITWSQGAQIKHKRNIALAEDSKCILGEV